MNSYVAGTLVRLTCTLQLSAGAVLTNATMAARVMLPDGTQVTLSAVNDSTGVYHADYLTAVLGLHRYEWIASGAATGANRGQFLVNQSTF